MSSDLPQEVHTAESELKLACLRVGESYYALDIMDVREIVRAVPLQQVPQAPAFVDGVMTLRKAVVPVVDLRRRFAVSPSTSGRERILVCAVHGRIIGLMVDEVVEVFSVSRQALQPSPYYLSHQENEFFPAVCRYAGRVMFFLRLDKILTDEQLILPEPIA